MFIACPIITWIFLGSFVLSTVQENINNTLHSVFGKRIPALSQISVPLDTGKYLKVWNDGKTLCSVTATETAIFDQCCFPFISPAYKLFYNDVFVTNFSVVEPQLALEVPSEQRICQLLKLTKVFLRCEANKFFVCLQYRPTNVLPQMQNRFVDVVSVPVNSSVTVIPEQSFALPGLYRVQLKTDDKVLKVSFLTKYVCLRFDAFYVCFLYLWFKLYNFCLTEHSKFFMVFLW